MNIIIKPIITEKMTAQADSLNRVAFYVEKRANKIQIKHAVQELYGVKVDMVNTLVEPSKNKSRFTRKGVIAGKTRSMKKAIVTLAKGESIDFYSNI